MGRQRLGFWRTLGRSNRLFPRKLVLTTQGRWIIAIALLLGAGAVNTGNNLLYLVLSLVIAVISISGILSELCLRDLVLRRAYPTDLTLGEVTPLRLEIENAKNRAALHLEAGEVVDGDDLLVRPGYVLHLGPRETGQAFASVRAMRRGPLQTVGLQVATGYPFGFARKARLHDSPATFLVLPDVAEVTLPWQGAVHRGGTWSSPRVGHGDAFRGLRDARAGDPLRDIHWKVSARRDRLVAREWEAEASRVAVVRFLHVAPSAVDDVHTLDAACASVAGLCAALLHGGLAVGLQTLQGAVAAEPDPTGDGAQLLRLRRHLAHLTLADRRPPADWPLPDAEWLDRCDAADACAGQIATKTPLTFATLPLHGPAEAWVVTFASRADAVPAGLADVAVSLDPTGVVAAVVRTVRAGAPLAAAGGMA